MDALLERCAKDLSPDGWATLARLGVERDKRLPAYDFHQWCQAVAYLAHAAHPDLEAGEAEYQLGRAFIERYAETFIGKALFAVLKVLGPRRILGRMARSFRTGTNFSSAEVFDETAHGALLRLGPVEPRGRFSHGLLERGLELAGVPGLTVALESLVDEMADFRITWT